MLRKLKYNEKINNQLKRFNYSKTFLREKLTTMISSKKEMIEVG